MHEEIDWAISHNTLNLSQEKIPFPSFSNSTHAQFILLKIGFINNDGLWNCNIPLVVSNVHFYWDWRVSEPVDLYGTKVEIHKVGWILPNICVDIWEKPMAFILMRQAVMSHSRGWKFCQKWGLRARWLEKLRIVNITR